MHPQITLLGPSTVALEVFSPYIEWGATAVDLRDGRVAVKVVSGPLVNTSTVTPADQPIRVVYEASDSAGNAAQRSRLVVVYDSCNATGEARCADTRQCSVARLCGLLASRVAASGAISAATGVGTTQTVIQRPPDRTPPVITLLGAGVAYTPPDGPGASGLITSVFVGDAYVDAGATARDEVAAAGGAAPTFVSVRVLVSIADPSGRMVTAVTTDSPTGNDTSPASTPYTITYSAVDGAGNTAVPARRRVHVLCRPPEFACPGDLPGDPLTCSSARICGLAAVEGASGSNRMTSTANSTQDGGAVAVVVESLPGGLRGTVEAQMIPRFILNSDPVVTISQGASYPVCRDGVMDECEPGGTATLKTQGDMNGLLRACATGVRNPLPYDEVGLQYCAINTRVPGTYRISFHLSWPSVGEIIAYRTLIVRARCEGGERTCSDGSCSVDMTCLNELSGSQVDDGADGGGGGSASGGQQDTAALVAGGAAGESESSVQRRSQGSAVTFTNAAPRLVLNTSAVVGLKVFVKRGITYTVCASRQAPTADRPCETLGVATDAEDGDLTSRIALCPPADCARTQCRAHWADRKQPSECGVDTAGGAVGSAFRLQLVVYDTKGANATAERVISVISPCATGQHYCEVAPAAAAAATGGGGNGTSSAGGGSVSPARRFVCSDIPCEERARLAAATGAGMPEEVRSVQLILLPALRGAGNATTTQPAAGGSQPVTLVVPYGRPTPVSLAPCAGVVAAGSAPAAAAAANSSCAAVANSTADGDVTGDIFASVTPLCPVVGNGEALDQTETGSSSNNSSSSSSNINSSNSTSSNSTTNSTSSNNSSSGGSGRCYSCSLAGLAAGLCLPGRYRITYSVSTLTAGAASETLEVAVEQLISTAISMSVFSNRTAAASTDFGFAEVLALRLDVNDTARQAFLLPILQAFGIEADSIRSLTLPEQPRAVAASVADPAGNPSYVIKLTVNITTANSDFLDLFTRPAGNASSVANSTTATNITNTDRTPDADAGGSASNNTVVNGTRRSRSLAGTIPDAASAPWPLLPVGGDASWPYHAASAPDAADAPMGGLLSAATPEASETEADVPAADDLRPRPSAAPAGGALAALQALESDMEGLLKLLLDAAQQHVGAGTVDPGPLIRPAATSATPPPSPSPAAAPAKAGDAKRSSSRHHARALASDDLIMTCDTGAVSAPDAKSAAAVGLASVDSISVVCLTPAVQQGAVLLNGALGLVSIFDRARADLEEAQVMAALVLGAQGDAQEIESSMFQTYRAAYVAQSRAAAASLSSLSARTEEARALVSLLLNRAAQAGQQAGKALSSAALNATLSLLQAQLNEAEMFTRSTASTAADILDGVSNYYQTTASEYTEYSTCVFERGDSATFAFRVGSSSSSGGSESSSSGDKEYKERRRLNVGSSSIGAASGGGSDTVGGVSGNSNNNKTAGLGGMFSVFEGYSLPAGAGHNYSLWDVRSLDRNRMAGVRNKVLAGLLLHQVRRSVSEIRSTTGTDGYVCRRSSFDGLVVGCDASADNDDRAPASGDLGGIGNDPVFNRHSDLFNSEMDPGRYYNLTKGAPDLNSAGYPYGFFHEPLQRFPLGYPLLFDTRMSARRAEQALTYVRDGAYLSPSFTKSLRAQLVTYNSDAQVFGYWRVDFTWSDSGVIDARTHLMGLPAVSYGDSIRNLQVGQFLPDFFLVLLVVAYSGMTARDIYCQLRLQHRRAVRARRRRRHRQSAGVTRTLSRNQIVPAAADRGAISSGGGGNEGSNAGGNSSSGSGTSSDDEMYDNGGRRTDGAAEGPRRRSRVKHRKAGGGRTYKPHMSPKWILYEAAICALMAAAIGVFYGYAVRLSVREEFTSRFDVYDADTFVPARYFLIRRRDDSGSGAMEAANSVTASGAAAAAIPEAGMGGRWALPADRGPLNDAGAMFARVDSMYNTLVTYTFLQGLVLALIVVRWLYYISFQRRLSIIIGTIALALPQLLHLALVAALCVALFAAAACLVFGPRVAQLSSFGGSVYLMLKYVLLYDDEGVFPSLLSKTVIKGGPEWALAALLYVLGPVLFLFVLASFILAILAWPFGELKYGVTDMPGVPQDLARILSWYWQRLSRRAPKNKRILTWIEAWLVEPEQSGIMHVIGRSVANLRATLGAMGPSRTSLGGPSRLRLFPSALSATPVGPGAGEGPLHASTTAANTGAESAAGASPSSVTAVARISSFAGGKGAAIGHSNSSRLSPKTASAVEATPASAAASPQPRRKSSSVLKLRGEGKFDAEAVSAALHTVSRTRLLRPPAADTYTTSPATGGGGRGRRGRRP
ncbi:hypothetical protein GPECTOR_13g665 [Gonium pectorale]|uniref:Polycystin cation channel PKD1/PKD2 domain-containing protein n=1 Tax=Gonium pectorale TaxID=33097 RepID=A0A150GN24_GONPE|nr:hypothetical protein GPECTOR_13g665 [Gonium pectorale]|eukprot:KXZ51178.1 hypothetical protein GPECTOR_13g665 [Gonium pectorale]